MPVISDILKVTSRPHSLSPDDRLFLKKIGRKIGEIRREKGFTQSQLAEKCGRSLQMIQYWESGHNLTLKSLYRLSQLLDQHVSDFLKPPEDMEKRMGRPVRFHPDGKGKKHAATLARLKRLPRQK